MATFILTWNPEVWPEGVAWLDESAGQATAASKISDNWSVGNRTGGIQVGDRALLLRQHHDRGIVASGRFASEVYKQPHWDGSARLANTADVDFDCVVTVDDRLPIDVLKAGVPSLPWDRLQGSGVRVPDRAEDDLLELWRVHVDAGSEAVIYPDDESPTYSEGSVQSIKVNRYERNRRAREACLAHYGAMCAVCGFDFLVTYGIAGGRGIHVHHLREMSEIGVDYVVDPVADLIPVCPNCHAAFHSRRPALTLDELREIIQAR